MDSNKELPTRKIIRVKNYNYSSKGAYLVTICTDDRKQLLSKICMHETQGQDEVGDGALDIPPCTKQTPQVILTPIGKIVEKHLLSSEKISGVEINCYVIMPDHIHAIIFLKPDKYENKGNGMPRAPSPTNHMIPHIVSTFKRFCNKEIGFNIFQRSYFEHIIRDKKDYETRRKYLLENPLRWYYKHMNQVHSNN